MENDLTVTPETFVDWFEAAEEASYEARQHAERDRDYYDNRQWTDAEVTELRKRKQPVITINRIQRKIDYLRGVEKQARTDPRAYARTPQHEQGAEAVTDSIRFVLDNNRADKLFSEAWDNLLVEGMEGVDVAVEQRRGRYEIILMRMPWDRMFYDPHSSEPDFSDARYLGGVRWMDMADAKRKYPNARDKLAATMGLVTDSDTYDDRPKWKAWADVKRDRVRVAQIWYQENGDWHWADFTEGGVLAGGKSPYVDEDGESECPLHFQSAYVNRDNERYGVVRAMIGPQDEINKRRSKALHLMTMRQVRVSQGAEAEGGDIDAIRRELAKPDGVIRGERDDIEILNNNDQIAGHFQMLQHATQEIDLMGPNAAMQGKGVQDQSGRAILAQQQGGMVEMATLLDRHSDLKMRVYRAIWHRIRQFWAEERWIRVTDDERNTRFVGLNQPRTVADRLGDLDESQRAGVMQRMGLVPNDPRLRQVIEVQNSVEEMDVDIVLQEVPDTATLQTEQFAELVNLARAGVVFPQETYIEASQLRNKDTLLEKLRGGGEMTPEQQQAAQAQQQIEQRNAAAEIAGKEAKAVRDAASANKTNIEAARLAAGVGD